MFTSRKSKKRQRQVNSISVDTPSDTSPISQQLRESTSDSRERIRLSPPRSNLLRSIPRVRVSHSDQPYLQSTSLPPLQKQPVSREGVRLSKREIKKNVRIMDPVQNFVNPAQDSDTDEVTVQGNVCSGGIVNGLVHESNGCAVFDGKYKYKSQTGTNKAPFQVSTLKELCSEGFRSVAPNGIETSHLQRDTSDEDLLAGKFEFVNVTKEVHSEEFCTESALHNLCPSKEKSSASDLESLPFSYALSRMSECGHRGDRNSVSEDTTDQKDEDNLSDTGHVSNSSNYNPSDSGPESDADNMEDDDSLCPPMSKSVNSLLESGAELTSNQSSLNISGILPSSSTSLSSLQASPRKMSLAQQQQNQDAESSGSEPGSPDGRQAGSGLTIRRRRSRANSNQVASDTGDGVPRPRSVTPKLINLRAQSKNTQTSGISSSENEAGGKSNESNNKVKSIIIIISCFGLLDFYHVALTSKISQIIWEYVQFECIMPY